MKKKSSASLKKFVAFVLLLMAITEWQKLNAQCPGGCTGNEKPLPQMWVSKDTGQHRFANFKSLYGQQWGFIHPEDISIEYNINSFTAMNNYFGTLGLASNDSIRVHIAACRPIENTKIPGTNITVAGPQTYKLLLIFSAIKGGTEQSNCVIDTVTKGFDILSDLSQVQMLENNYNSNPLINVTSAVQLDSNDPHNKLNYDATQPITNTSYMSYIYADWKEYFEDELLYQQIKNPIDSVTASFASFDGFGDGLTRQGYTIPERVNRLHLIFQFSAKGKTFSVEDTPEFCCRKRKTDSIRAAARHTILLEYNKIITAQESKVETLKKQKMNKASLQYETEKRTLSYYYIARDKLFPGGGGNSTDGGGDNGQANP